LYYILPVGQEVPIGVIITVTNRRENMDTVMALFTFNAEDQRVLYCIIGCAIFVALVVGILAIIFRRGVKDARKYSRRVRQN
jgi:hypothetical protein